MKWPDTIGRLTAIQPVAFCARHMIPLRFAALGGNIAALACGLALGLVPVRLPQAILLPVNAWLFFEAIRQGPRGSIWNRRHHDRKGGPSCE